MATTLLRLTTGVVYVRSFSGGFTGSGGITLTSGQLLVPDGTASIPSIAAISDPDTGLFWGGGANNTLCVTAGTAQVVRFSGIPAVNLDAAAQLNWGSNGFTSVDLALFRGAANRLDFASGDSFNLVDGAGTINSLALGTTPTNGLSVINTTAAGAGAQQVSPPLIQQGSGWKTNATAASQTVAIRQYVLPVQGAAAPSYEYRHDYSIAGAAYANALRTIADGVGGTVTLNATASSGLHLASSGGFVVSDNHFQIFDTQNLSWGNRITINSPSDGILRLANIAATGFSSIQYGPAGNATTSAYIQKKITAIADNTATTVFTVTVPNANHAVAIRLMFLSSNGSTDAFESSRCASGMVVCTRTTGNAAVATAAAIDDAAIATIPASATHTLAYSVTAPAGGAGASNTFTIQVTIDDSGNLGSNQVVAIAELLNAEATGCTIA